MSNRLKEAYEPSEGTSPLVFSFEAPMIVVFLPFFSSLEPCLLGGFLPLLTMLCSEPERPLGEVSLKYSETGLAASMSLGSVREKIRVRRCVILGFCFAGAPAPEFEGVGERLDRLT